MHETHIVESILRYFEAEERSLQKPIKKVYIALSEFGGMSKEHFMEHFREAVAASKWQSIDVEIKKIPYGPELEITRIEFATAETQK